MRRRRVTSRRLCLSSRFHCLSCSWRSRCDGKNNRKKCQIKLFRLSRQLLRRLRLKSLLSASWKWRLRVNWQRTILWWKSWFRKRFWRRTWSFQSSERSMSKRCTASKRSCSRQSTKRNPPRRNSNPRSNLCNSSWKRKTTLFRNWTWSSRATAMP